MVFNIVYCAKMVLGMPRSGDFDMPSSNPLCFSTQFVCGVVGMLCIGALLKVPVLLKKVEYVLAH